MKKIIFTAIIFALILTGCSDPKPTSNKQNLTVYTTVYPLQYFTERIGGDFVEVHTVYPSGSDEHSFEPTQKEVMKIADADEFFYIGFGLEGFVDRIKKSLNNENVNFVAIGEKTPEAELVDADAEEVDEHDHSSINPHIWLDPLLCIEMSESIKNELSDKMPEHKADFEQNFEQLRQELLTLNQDFLDVTFHVERKEFVVTHAAFSYWESRYGIKQVAISGLSTADEPSQKQMKSLIDLVNADHIEYILVEQNVNKKFAETIQNETGVKLLPIHNLAILTEKEVGHADYFSIMRSNLDSLQKAMGDPDSSEN